MSALATWYSALLPFEPGGATVKSKLCVHRVGSGSNYLNQDLAGSRAWSLDVPLFEEIRSSELRCDHSSHDLTAPFLVILSWAILSHAPAGTLIDVRLVGVPPRQVYWSCRRKHSRRFFPPLLRDGVAAERIR